MPGAASKPLQKIGSIYFQPVMRVAHSHPEADIQFPRPQQFPVSPPANPDERGKPQNDEQLRFFRRPPAEIPFGPAMGSSAGESGQHALRRRPPDEDGSDKLPPLEPYVRLRAL